MPVANAERGEREPALNDDRRRAARFRAAPFGARGADAELPKRIVSPAVHGAGGGEPAGERNPGADGDEGEVAAHRQGRPRARGRPAAEAAGGIVAPAVGGAARRQGTAQHPACAQRRKRAPAGDGDRCRAAPRSLETAAFRSRRVGPNVTWTSDASAVATVDPSGGLAGVAPGSATITAAAESKSGTATVGVEVVSFATVQAGAYHACGLTAGGAAYCWGHGTYGQIGEGAKASDQA